MTLAVGLPAAIVAALKADAGVTAMCGARVYAQGLASAPYPHLVFGALKSRAWNTGEARGEEIVFSVEAMARSRDEAMIAAAAAASALDGAALSWPGARAVTLFHADSDSAVLKDRETWRATGRFRVLAEAG